MYSYCVHRGLPAGIYETYDSNACHFVAENCKANIIVVENQTQLEKILEVSLAVWLQVCGDTTRQADVICIWSFMHKVLTTTKHTTKLHVTQHTWWLRPKNFWQWICGNFVRVFSLIKTKWCSLHYFITSVLLYLCHCMAIKLYFFAKLHISWP